MRSNLRVHPSGYFNHKFATVSLTWLAGLVFCIGCGSKQVVLIPDYDNEYYRSEELLRPGAEVVETIDARDSSPERLGTAKVGMFNAEAPCLLSEPASEFITNSVNTMLGAATQTERICPITVRIDGLEVKEIDGGISGSGFADCQLSFSFPVNADSTSVTKVSAVRKDGAFFDATSTLDNVLYESVMTCTQRFLAGSYDPAPAHFLVARADVTSSVDKDLRTGNSLGAERSRLAAESNSLEGPSAKEWRELAVYYHYFTGEEMQDAYDHGFGFALMGGENISEKFCFGVETSLFLASGTPVERPGSTWLVDSSDLFLISIPVSVSLIYPAHGDREGSFLPYVGIGGGGIFGYELMQAKLSRFWEGVDVGNGIFRAAWTGEIFLGAEFGKWAANPFIEFRGTVSGRSSVSRGLSEEEQEQLDESLYDALIRPDGNMAGVQFCLGIRW
jgi:hypothetical protein